MYGLIGKITAVAGERDALAQILRDGTRDMPNCVSYVIGLCASDTNVLWVTEVWKDEASHVASLQLPSVQAAIGAGRPLIAGMERIATTQPIG
ncbi:putative quinol monooxygenase [Hirschia litorea]|uniref:Quinol monooxygenase n=1 Tax=Hirschia litorea TaxID=1199156 RepID=A0ABW2IM34_9PROT